MKLILSRLASALIAALIFACPARLWSLNVAVSTEDEAKLHIGIREVPAVMALPSKVPDGNTRFVAACAALEKRLQFPTGLLQRQLKEFAQKLLQSADT